MTVKIYERVTYIGHFNLRGCKLVLNDDQLFKIMGRRLSKLFFSFYKDKFCPDLTYMLRYGILQQYVTYLLRYDILQQHVTYLLRYDILQQHVTYLLRYDILQQYVTYPLRYDLLQQYVTYPLRYDILQQ